MDNSLPEVIYRFAVVNSRHGGCDCPKLLACGFDISKRRSLPVSMSGTGPLPTRGSEDIKSNRDDAWRNYGHELIPIFLLANQQYLPKAPS